MRSACQVLSCMPTWSDRGVAPWQMPRHGKTPSHQCTAVREPRGRGRHGVGVHTGPWAVPE
eukprot:366571-Chlamydomonas_euryale.AAC.17